MDEERNLPACEKLAHRNYHHCHRFPYNSSQQASTCPFHALDCHLGYQHYTKQEKTEFALFLKVLLRCLEKVNQLFLMQQVRLTVLTCVRGSKIGDSSFYPLIEAIEIRVKKLVGSSMWEQAQTYTGWFLDHHDFHQEAHFSSQISRCSPMEPSSLIPKYTEQI